MRVRGVVEKIQDKCLLCDFPLGRSRFQKEFDGQMHAFCCPGCLHVYEILSSRPDAASGDFRNSDLYRAFDAAGLIRQGGGDESPAGNDSLADRESELAEEGNWRIEGMWCTACGWVIEEVIRKTPGILSAEVSFITDSLRIRYLPHRLELEGLKKRIADFGYRMADFSAQDENDRVKKDLLVRFGVSSILTMNIMMISFSLYFGFLGVLDDAAVRYLSYPIALMGTAVVFYGGFPILRNAWKSIRVGSMTMDALIGTGALSAYFYSIVRMRSGSIHLYFDTASMLITLVLLGRLIDIHIRHKITAGIDALHRLSRQKVRLIYCGRERWTDPEAVQVGELFQVREGERVPIDGRIVSGRARLDESILTGESRPVSKKIGEDVRAGSLLIEGEACLEAIRIGSESTVGQMISLVQQALTRKNTSEDLADRITRKLVPLILLLSAGTAVFWHLYTKDIDESLLRAITVLVITCPCALGIAVPLAKVAAISFGRSKGVLIRSQEALEKVRDLDTIVLDKTGTLTEGRFALRHIHTASSDTPGVLERLAAVESHSDHFLAGEILRRAASEGISVQKAENFQSFEGLGVSGIYRREEIFAGNRSFMDRQGLASTRPDVDRLAESYERSGMTTVFFGWQGVVQGFLAFGDQIKPTSRITIEKLRSRGLEVRLLSGDSIETTRAVARELGIDAFKGQMLPAEKAEVICSLQAEGRRVGMVGDGVNDAPALAASDLGFAMGGRANPLQSASDLTLLSSDPAVLDEMFSLSLLASRVLRQNLFFAFIYNVLGIPLAIGGLLNPLIAVVAMFASSLTVIGNTLRISNSKKEPRRHLAPHIHHLPGS
ncbi:MAG: heavy metal translocating P-type ATPase [Desulfobacteraceae bacterium]|nr:MAG: heavy metal translocating P-type ATPase [Desulfobacteraceae bacterium]